MCVWFCVNWICPRGHFARENGIQEQGSKNSWVTYLWLNPGWPPWRRPWAMHSLERSPWRRRVFDTSCGPSCPLWHTRRTLAPCTLVGSLKMQETEEQEDVKIIVKQESTKKPQQNQFLFPSFFPIQVKLWLIIKNPSGKVGESLWENMFNFIHVFFYPKNPEGESLKFPQNRFAKHLHLHQRKTQESSLLLFSALQGLNPENTLAENQDGFNWTKLAREEEQETLPSWSQFIPRTV